MITNNCIAVLWCGLLLVWGFCAFMRTKINRQNKTSTSSSIIKDTMISSGSKPDPTILKPYDLLDEIESTTSVSQKAAIFIDLMRSKYILIHTLTNEGNMYNDELQVQRFERGLTDDVIKYINCIEGKDIC